MGRLRWCSQVPPADNSRSFGAALVALGRRRLARRPPPHIGRDELRGYLRPPERGLRPLQHGPALARPPFRTDALRQRFTRPRVHPRLAVDRLTALSPGG